MLEGDTMCICNVGEAWSSVQNIVSRTIHLAQAFRTTAFSHTKRQRNVPANLLAQHAANIENYIAWLEEYPNHVELACTHDVSSFKNNE